MKSILVKHKRPSYGEFLNDKSNGSIVLLQTLKKTFGFSAFRPFQEEIVSHILARKDVFAVMPTGGGKSLCYQLPAKLMHGTVIVVSPLISLMKDQVDGAVESGIRAAYLNSSLAVEESRNLIQRLRNQELEMLYIAPERFSMDYFSGLLKTVPISLFAIDEAHCISEWGHDFRPDYLNLSGIRSHFPDIPIAAFTATATTKVQDDVTRKLGLKSPYKVRASFDRPNLHYRVEKKQNVEDQVLAFLAQHKDEPGIIYRTTRKSTLALAEFLQDNDIKAACYHAGLSPQKRQQNQEAFNNDEIQVMVATIAFGMGIDKSNVRFIIHADLPKNIESYYQETGRSGRDGEVAHCLLLFGRGDIPKIRYFIDRIENETEKAAAIVKLNSVARFASQSVCRRKQLLAYFGESYEPENCSHCDICLSDLKKVDITTEAQMIMSAIMRSGERFGSGHIIDIVRGADTKRIRQFMHQNLKTYGIGSKKDKDYWRFIIDELIAQDKVIQEGERYPSIKISEKGREVLFGREKLYAIIKEAPVFTHEEREQTQCDPKLMERLKKLRKEISIAHKVAPYIVFTDRSLHEMACYYPTTPESFLQIAGVGEKKLSSYGADFMKEIKSYLEEYPRTRIPDKPVKKEGKEKGKKEQTIDVSFELFSRGLTPVEVARKRGLAPGTIAVHLEQCILKGYKIDINQLVSPEKLKIVGEFLMNYSIRKLTPIVEFFKGEVSFEEARFVRAWIERKE